jgi:RNA polymerase sigma-70 factor (ECF subfamily)
MKPSDEELVLRFQSGDLSAFDELVARWQRKIRGAIYRILGSDEEARDLSQEVFLKAFRNLQGFKRESRFSSWLYQIALNLCRDRMRRKKGKRMVGLEVLESEAPPPRVIEASLDHALDLSHIVAAAVWALPEEHREVIVLKEYEGLTFAEIAETLGLPPSTVKTRLYRGLVQLREMLERQGIRSAAALAMP